MVGAFLFPVNEFRLKGGYFPIMTHAMKLQDFSEEEQITTWLRDNPDFFNRHPDLLPAAISASGKVLSLEAGHLDQLRRNNDLLRKNIDGMMARVRRNEEIFRQFHATQMSMISANTPEQLLHEVTEVAERQFNVFRITVAVSNQEEGLTALLAPLTGQEESRVVGIDHEALLRVFGRSDDPVVRIGREGNHRRILFGEAADNIRSEVLIPLHAQTGSDAAESRLVGSLNLGGDSMSRFLPSDATDLLCDMADVFALSLLRFLDSPRLRH